MSEAATPQEVLADVDDFLAWVQGQRERYELVGGRLVMMAGGSEGFPFAGDRALGPVRQAA